MQSSIVKIGITVLVSLMTVQSFAGGGQVGSAETLLGTYIITGPTNDLGDENTVTFTSDGVVHLSQKSAWGNKNCNGKFQIKNGLLKAAGSCFNSVNYSDFEMSIDLTEVSNLGYFRAPVLSKTIYVKPVQMEFLQRK
ncbi:hypothetical protein ACLVWU_15500 [Bdellovibrio sp. HCB290]|uniref:hypothetical protein n=1 Tax=Bdellovibrio sp. HCB290 TaxID=3394356 RepID=UPI0039B65311